MDIAIKDVSPVQKEIRIQATPEELAPHFEKAYKHEQARLAIKGFRKGKAPLDLVKRIYGEAIEYDALSDIANTLYREIANERHIHPIGDPVLADMNYKRGEELSFTIRYEIKPEFELGTYKKIEVEKIVHPVTEAEIDDEVSRIRKANSTYTDVQTASDHEHLITVDTQELDDTGAPLIGRKSSDMKIYLADENVYPEVKEALSSVSVGDVRKAKIEVERDGAKLLNNLQFTIKKIEKVTLPDLNADLLKKVTKNKVESVEEFRLKMRSDLEAYWNDFTERTLSDSIVHEIVHKHDFAVPESFITSITDSYIEDMKNQSPKKQLPAEFDEAKFRQEYRASAIFQAKWYLIREKILEREGLEVSDAELEERATADAPRMGIETERLLQFYKTSASVKDRISTEKLMSMLKQSAIITEKTDTATT